MKYNILITAIGSFSAAEVINSLKKDSRIDAIFGCDIFPKEWHYISKDFNEVFQSPMVVDEMAYFEFIKKIIKEKKIEIIIPLTDIEIDFFNKYRDTFDEVLIVMGNKNFITLARDKEKLNIFLKENDFPFVPTFSYDEILTVDFPFIGKPKDGRSSEGVIIMESPSTLNKDQNYTNYIFQKFIQGDIWTIDVLRNNFSKEIRLISRKELIRTKNGAGVTVELFYDENLIRLATQISERMQSHGVYNMEFIRSDDKDYLIDVNPRFSAGIGFTRLIDYDIVRNTLNLFENKTLEGVESYYNLIAQKHYVEVINKKL